MEIDIGNIEMNVGMGFMFDVVAKFSVDLTPKLLPDGSYRELRAKQSLA